MAAIDKVSTKSTKKTHPSTSSDAPIRIPSIADSKTDFPILVNENLAVIEPGASFGTKGASGGSSGAQAKSDSSKCKCCEKPLYTGANCLPTVPLMLGAIPQIISGIEIKKLGKPTQVNQSIGTISRLSSLGQVKYNRCSSCNGYVCRHCKGECHECIVRKQLVLEPEAMLQMNRREIIGLLQTLHYPKHHFDNWETTFLVKQIFTRFNVQQDWIPRPSNVNSAGRIKKAQPNGKHHSFTEYPTINNPKESMKEEKPKRPQSQSSSNSKFYDIQVSTSTQLPNKSSAKSAATAQPGAIKVTNPSTVHKSTKNSKSQQEGTYKDMKLVVDDIPEMSKNVNSHQDSKKQEENGQKTRKVSNISSTSTLPLTNKLEVPQQGPTDKSQTNNQPKPVSELHVLKHNSPKLTKKAETTKSKDNISDASTPSRQRKVDQLKIMDRLDYSLKDISSLKDIDDIPIKQIKRILKRHSIDVKAIASEDDMRYTVKRIWHFRKEKENEALMLSESMEDLRQNKRQQQAVKDKLRSRSESQLNQETSQDQAKKMQAASRTRSEARGLETLASFESIENLDSSHLCMILNYHNINPDKYKTQQELVYAVQCLWKAIHAPDNIGGTKRDKPKSAHKILEKKTVLPATEEPKNPSTNVNKFLSINNFRSVMELERLTEEELKEILIGNSINPGKYTDKHELYYAVLLLWNSKHIAAKETRKTISTPIRAEDQKTEYVKSWLLKHDDISVPQQATEVRQSGRKREPTPHVSNSEQVLKITDIDGTKSELPKRVHKTPLEKKTVLPVTEEPKNPSLKVNKFPSISNIRSVMELESLTEEELKEILKRYSINSGQYTEKHELHYAVLRLWNSKKIAAKETPKNIHSTSTAAEDQKTEYVKYNLMKYDAAPQQAREVRQSERKRKPTPHTSTYEQVLKIVDNSAAMQQLTEQRGQATRQVIGSIPEMGTQQDMKQKQNIQGKTMETAQHAIKNHEPEAQNSPTAKSTKEAASSMIKVTKERHHASARQDINNSTSEIIYTEIAEGRKNQTYEGPKKMTAKLEMQTEVVYAELTTSPQHFPSGDACSSILSFGERIAPGSTEIEFAYIDDTFSEISVNQGTRNDRNTSNASSYYSKLFDAPTRPSATCNAQH